MFLFKQISLMVSLHQPICSFEYDTVSVIYKDKSHEFESSFEIVIDNLHELLFGNFFIVFSRKKRGFLSGVIDENICGAEIFMNQIAFEENKKASFDLYTTNGLFDSLYYTKYKDLSLKGESYGKIYLEFKSTNLMSEFVAESNYGLYNQIYKLIFSPDTVSSAKALSNIVATIFYGKIGCQIKNITGFFMNNNIFTKFINKDKESFCTDSGCLVKNCIDRYSKIDTEQAKEALYFANLALAAYLDSSVMKFLIKKEISLSDVKDPKIRGALERASFYSVDNVLEYSEGSTESSGYIVFTDNDTMVISLRGTLSTSDVVSDLYASYSPFLNGFSHTGIMQLAEKFFDKKLPKLLGRFPEGHIKNLYFTGHSLGGALATHLYIRAMKSELKKKYNIKAVVFSAPQTISRHIFSVVDFSGLSTYNFSDDIVPRISLGTILEYKYLCISVAAKCSIFSDQNQIYEYMKEIRNHIKSIDFYPKLYQPGTIYHIKSYKLQDKSIKYGFKEVDSQFFAEMIYNNDFLGDHLIINHIKAFEYIMNSKHDYETPKDDN